MKAITLAFLCALSVTAEGHILNQNVTATNTKVESEIQSNLYSGVTNEISPKYTKSMMIMKKAEISINTICRYPMYTNCCVNIRMGADIDEEIITTINPNTVLEVTGRKGKWSKVVLSDGTHGYLKSEFLSENEVPISELNRWGIDLTVDEKNLLAQIVYLEAGIDSIEGKEAVIESIFNRMVFSKAYHGDLYSVLSRQGQYTTWPARNNARPGEEEYMAIDRVLNGITYILDFDYVYFSLGKSNGHDFVKVGKHWFGRE